MVKAYVGGRNIVLKGTTIDSYSEGRDIGGLSIWKIVQTAITNKAFPLDTNAIYVVMASRYISLVCYILTVQLMIQSSLCTTVTLGTLKSGLCSEDGSCSEIGSKYYFNS